MNASGRPNTCKSNGKVSSEIHECERVRNAYATYPIQGDSPEKSGLIPHGTVKRHFFTVKDLSVWDGHASD